MAARSSRTLQDARDPETGLTDREAKIFAQGRHLGLIEARSALETNDSAQWVSEAFNKLMKNIYGEGQAAGYKPDLPQVPTS
jgi:hypothetical protein